MVLTPSSRDAVQRASLHRPGALEDVRSAYGLDPEVVRRIRNALYKEGLPPSRALAPLPAPVRAGIESALVIESLRLVERHDSRSDGATKLVLRNRDDLALECVLLRPRTGRSSVCVSAQVGCAAACRFCATGRMGIARNLGADEILEQVALAGRLLRAESRRLRNVVFMGMGEPMHNRAAVEAAVARLIDPRWFALSARHVVVSTIGPPDDLLAFVERFPAVRIAISLHTARDATRARLMPLAARTSLAELHHALRTIQTIQRQPTMLEYLLLEGVNDTDADLTALLTYCADLDVHVNVIPYNPIAGSTDLRPSSPARQADFTRRLKDAGLTVTTRYSLGQDIAAACGQLARDEHRRADQRAAW